MAEVKWHDSARKHLRKVFDFNCDNFSATYAYRVLTDILDAVQGLESNPRKGAPELLLDGRKYEYRHLVIEKKYKVIYFLVKDEAHVIAIWDVRQNPKTLIRSVK
jgi:plasmid stabilization system protein ParE